jgi:hypothetical protein
VDCVVGDDPYQGHGRRSRLETRETQLLEAKTEKKKPEEALLDPPVCVESMYPLQSLRIRFETQVEQ